MDRSRYPTRLTRLGLEEGSADQLPRSPSGSRWSGRPDVVFQIGVVPQRVALLTSITGVTFDEAWANRVHVEIGELEVPVLGRSELVRNKRAVGRTRDLADIEELGEDP